jgi:hypothetical protein
MPPVRTHIRRCAGDNLPAEGFCSAECEVTMKVNGNPHHQDMRAAAARHAPQTRSDAAAAAAFMPGAALGTAPVATPAHPASSAAVESTLELAARKLPPGLVRVAARFEAAGAEGPGSGQSHAQAQVARNLQRFAEAHASVAPPAPPPVAPAVIDAAPEGTGTPSEPVPG